MLVYIGIKPIRLYFFNKSTTSTGFVTTPTQAPFTNTFVA